VKIGLSMLYCLGQPFSYLLKELRKVQVESVEVFDEGYHAFNGRRVRAVKKIAQERGLQVTVHSPLADVNIASPAGSFREAVLKRLKRSILLSSQLDASLWVFHPGLRTGISHFYPNQDWELNLKSVHELKDTAEQCSINISIENCPEPFPFLLRSVTDFCRFYAELGETDIGLTLDVGHANTNNQIYEFIDEFPERIVHTHLHDNRGDFDNHLGIGDGNIDWPRVIKAFKSIDYKRTLLIEAEKNVEESLRKLRTLIDGTSRT